MQEPTLRDVFRASWKLTMHHKGLWIFGLFALVFGQLGILDVLSGIVKGTSGQPLSGVAGPVLYAFSPSTLHEVGTILNFSFDSWATLVWLLVMLGGLGLAILVVAAIAQGGIVHATGLSMEHGLRSIEKFDEAWHAGARHFSSILLLNILKKCIMFATSLIVSLAAFVALISTSHLSNILFVISFISAAILGLTLSMLTVFAIGYLVIEKQTLFESIRRAWKLFISHWLVSFEVGMVLIVLNLIVFLLLCIGLYVFVAPSLAFSAYGALIGNTGISQFGVSMAIVLFVSYAAILGSIFTVFVTSSWTYLFVIMHRWGFKSRIHAWVTSLRRS